MTQLELEPRENGRWFTKHEDGSEVMIGHVLKYEPYDLFVLSWKINGDFQYDPELVTEVEVHFFAEGPSTTKVKFEHKNLQLLGGGKAVESMDSGWGMILELYKKVAES